MGKIKKGLIIAICSLMLVSLTLPFYAVNAYVGNWVINYSVVYTAGVFKLNGVNVNLDSDVVQSMQITYPSSVTYNEPALPGGWTRTAGSNTVNYQITSNGDSASVISFLNAISFSGTYGISTGNITVELNDRSIASITGGDGKPHFYEYIPISNSTSWYTAYDAARASTYNGLTGYLATITSKNENDFIFNSLTSGVGNRSSWIGGIRYKDNGTDKINNRSEVSSIVGSLSGTDDWYWTSGPEGAESFYDKAAGTTLTYSNWSAGQPDGTGSGEGCLQFGFNNSANWNDLACSGSQGLVYGYIIEYSEYGGQTTIADNKTYTAPLPVPPPVTPPSTPAPSTPKPGATCQDIGYPPGYYWNGSECVTNATSAPVTSYGPINTKVPQASATPRPSSSPGPLATGKPHSSADASPSPNALVSPNASSRPSSSPSASAETLEIVKINGDLYNILNRANTIFGEELYVEHQVSLERFWAYPRLGLMIKDFGKFCILHLFIILIAFIAQLIYNHTSMKNLERYYECLIEEDEDGDI